MTGQSVHLFIGEYLMSSDNIKKLQAEIEQALKYYNFWDQQRHLPTAAQTANYFAERLQLLRAKLNECERQQSNHSGSSGEES